MPSVITPTSSIGRPAPLPKNQVFKTQNTNVHSASAFINDHSEITRQILANKEIQRKEQGEIIERVDRTRFSKSDDILSNKENSASYINKFNDSPSSSSEKMKVEQLNQAKQNDDSFDSDYVYIPLTEEILIPWSQTISQNPQSIDLVHQKRKNSLDPTTLTQFPVDDKANEKLYLWSGDITSLNLDGLVCSTVDTFDTKEPSSLGSRLIRAGGEQFKETCKEVCSLRSGETVVTSGFNLPYKNVIHTGSPKYSEKYRTAAENALYTSYRNCLQVAREKNIKTLGILPIHNKKKHYSCEKGAHIALRTIRRYMEKNSNSFQMIVLIVSHHLDIRIYNSLVPLYFPRNICEEEAAIELLPDDTGNEFGEPLIAERVIRLSGRMNNESEHNQLVNPNVIASLGFGTLQGDLDHSRQSFVSINNEHTAENEKRKNYYKWLQWSKREDLSELQAMNFLYRAGNDRQGHPLVVFRGNNFVPAKMNLNYSLLYTIQVMEHVVGQPYTIVFFPSKDPKTFLSKEWLRTAYRVLDTRYYRHLKTLYIVDSNVLHRVSTWLFCKSLERNLHKKVTYTSLQHLYQEIPKFRKDE